VTVVDSLVLKLEVCDRVSVGKMEELILADGVGDKDMDSDDDNEPMRDPVREAVFAVVGEGEAETVALVERVEAGVAERERLWLWLTVDDPDPDRVAIEDMVMELLADMETEADEERDVDCETLEDTSLIGERLELGLEEGVEDTVVL